MILQSKTYQEGIQSMRMNLYKKKQKDIEKMKKELCSLKDSEKFSKKQLEKYIKIYEKKIIDISNKLYKF